MPHDPAGREARGQELGWGREGLGCYSRSQRKPQKVLALHQVCAVTLPLMGPPERRRRGKSLNRQLWAAGSAIPLAGSEPRGRGPVTGVAAGG